MWGSKTVSQSTTPHTHKHAHEILSLGNEVAAGPNGPVFLAWAPIGQGSAE